MLRALVLLIYNLLLPLGLLAMAPGAWKKMRQRGGKTGDLWQRLGFFDRQQAARLRALRSDGGVFWIHAVSVGEVGIAAKLVRELLVHQPGLRFALTTTTPTGFTLAVKLSEELAGALVPLYSPVDGWFSVRRFLRAINPRQLVLVEAEVWPNLVFAATRRGIPVTLVNARLSARSEQRFRSLRPLIAPVYAMLHRVCVQEPEDTARFAITFGIAPQKLACTGSIKFDTAADTVPTSQIAQFRDLLGSLGWNPGDPIVLAASTHPGEEIQLACIIARMQRYLANLRLIIVPRHVERAEQILEELCRESLPAIRRSALTNPQPSGARQIAEGNPKGEGGSLSQSAIRHPRSEDTLLVDTTGELRAWQHLATVVVIGKSFLATGGQNPAEAVMAGKPVVFGPHMENFDALVRLLLATQGAVQVQDLPALEFSLARLLRDPTEAARLAAAGRDALKAHEGSTRRTASLLL